MPELPEVETIRRQLEEALRGDDITSVTVLDRKVFTGAEESLVGETIDTFHRVGKYLFMHFRSGRGVGIHLKMTGRMIIDKQEYADMPHTRIRAHTHRGRSLYYWDTRRFGYWKVWERIAEEEEKILQKLGPEPWNIDASYLMGFFRKSKRSVKEVILDQNILAGVGNIYANDALWLAGIDPRRSAHSLSKHESEILLASIRAVLERGLATGGASDNTYVDALAQKGTYQNEFLVYRRTGQPCRRDRSPLVRTVIGGRGTWFCEKCQK